MSLKTKNERLEAEDAKRETARKLAPILVAVADDRMVDAVQLYDVLPHGEIRAKFLSILDARYGLDEADCILREDFHDARVMIDGEYRKIRARQNAEAQIAR